MCADTLYPPSHVPRRKDGGSDGRMAMSFVIAAPEAVASAASNLASIGSTIGEANAAAVAPTIGVVAAAEDEVSAAIASLFSSYAQRYRALSAQAAAVHTLLVQTLKAAAGAYPSTEAANVAQILLGAVQQIQQQTQPEQQILLSMVNAPTDYLLGRPLIGNGANGTTVNGKGTAGRFGGLLYGNGGNGGNSTNPGAPGGAGGAAGLFGNGGTGGAGGAAARPPTPPRTGGRRRPLGRGRPGGAGGARRRPPPPPRYRRSRRSRRHPFRPRCPRRGRQHQ